MGLFSSKPQKTTTTSTEKHKQDANYDKLLGGADSWLDQGGMGNQPNITGQLSDILAAQGNHYQNVLTGEADRTALNNALAAQGDAAQKSFERNTLTALNNQAQAVGGGGGSRNQIAQGIAAGDMQANLQNQQAQTINQFEQQRLQNQMQAAGALGNTFQQGAMLDQMMQANTPEAKRLQSLLAYQNMISGNMGGTTTSNSTQTGGGGSLGSQILGGAMQLGAAYMTGGAQIAAQGAAKGAASSDERLKKKIKKVKTKKGKKVKTKDGIDLAEWEWNKKAKDEYGLEGKASGVLAQEVEKKRPDAVKKDKKGYRKVDYGVLG